MSTSAILTPAAKSFFYSPDEGIAFWVAGYCLMNVEPVEETLKRFEGHLTKFVAMTSVERSAVRTDLVTRSSRYDGMRMYHAKVPSCPPEAMDLGAGWTMQKWLA